MENTSVISLNGSSRTDFMNKLFRTILQHEFDCQLIVNGQIIPCHRLLLMAASPCFDKHFSQENPTSKISLIGIQYCDLLDILRYIYTGCISVEANRLSDLMGAAKKLGVQLPITVTRHQPNNQFPTPKPLHLTKLNVKVTNVQIAGRSQDKNIAPPVLHGLGLKRRSESINEKASTARPFPIYMKTTLENEEPIIVDDDADEDEEELDGKRKFPTQLTDPTKIIKKRDLRPYRKVDYENEKIDTFDIKEEVVEKRRDAMRQRHAVIYCRHCDKPFNFNSIHECVCEMNPERSFCRNVPTLKNRRKTMM